MILQKGGQGDNIPEHDLIGRNSLFLTPLSPAAPDMQDDKPAVPASGALPPSRRSLLSTTLLPVGGCPAPHAVSIPNRWLLAADTCATTASSAVNSLQATRRLLSVSSFHRSLM